MADGNRCPNCGCDRPSKAANGLCARCLLQQGLDSEAFSLARGGIYDASIGGHKMTFAIDAKAKSGPAPIVSRLLRFQ